MRRSGAERADIFYLVSKQVLTPVLDAKRRIVAKARSSVAAALAVSVVLYGTEIFAGTQSSSFPSLGIDPSSALLAVSVFSVIVVGLVLADKNAIEVHGSEGEDSRTLANKWKESAHTQASALILADTLTGVSIFTAFIGIGALVRAGQLMVAPMDESNVLQNIEMAVIVGGIAWTFVLLAAANLKSPAEVTARAAYRAEIYSKAVRRRGDWQRKWMRAGDGLGVFTDVELKSILGKTGNAVRLTIVSGMALNFLLFFIFFAVADEHNATGIVLNVLKSATAALPIALFFALVGTIAQFPLRRATVAQRNGQGWSCVGWGVATVACVAPPVVAAGIAVSWMAVVVFFLYASVLAAAWILYRSPEVTSVSVEAGGDLAVTNKAFGLAALHAAVREQLRTAPLPIEPAGPAFAGSDSALMTYLTTGNFPGRQR